ncbi:recombinase family protein [Streptomyces sp. PTM05]|uniref:Recombinase family protein n=1 Tax=Streptantibioticus parmotrematis TaxID=2873249 RepID=A0ABS7QJ78_9ACTN|nr:recombinase family protein [Streptantibioticus parmotrematis]MBY8883228.1 recombinase family protein [Streptantibioticus parmotrematis]
MIRPDGTIDWVVIHPKFRQLLADLAAGAIDGVTFYDLDRLMRQPRDLEDPIDIIKYVQRPAVGPTSGRMNPINDSDHHMARPADKTAAPQTCKDGSRLAEYRRYGRRHPSEGKMRLLPVSLEASKNRHPPD